MAGTCSWSFQVLADIGEDHVLFQLPVSLVERALTPAGGVKGKLPPTGPKIASN